MRKPFFLLLAIVLIVGAAAWWTFGGWDIAVSVVPGWHVSIVAPWTLASAIASAALLAVALVVVLRQRGA